MERDTVNQKISEAFDEVKAQESKAGGESGEMSEQPPEAGDLGGDGGETFV